jgi:hypothetical protein
MGALGLLSFGVRSSFCCGTRGRQNSASELLATKWRQTPLWDRFQIERVLNGRWRRPAPNGQTWTLVDPIVISLFL